ncbi:uncharacterized protein LOC120349501 [Nilaparvata lugens]|uniref:uncharacterized protein LOC120349501 n=1 Tax=Nilaparvata lugens TaxID=108931 RepID=UPI00193D6EBE|nr:uncharacterized protein LOC120349501 [Nilaparvata lugens]
MTVHSSRCIAAVVSCCGAVPRGEPSRGRHGGRPGRRTGVVEAARSSGVGVEVVSRLLLRRTRAVDLRFGGASLRGVRGMRIIHSQIRTTANSRAAAARAAAVPGCDAPAACSCPNASRPFLRLSSSRLRQRLRPTTRPRATRSSSRWAPTMTSTSASSDICCSSRECQRKPRNARSYCVVKRKPSPSFYGAHAVAMRPGLCCRSESTRRISLISRVSISHISSISNSISSRRSTWCLSAATRRVNVATMDSRRLRHHHLRRNVRGDCREGRLRLLAKAPPSGWFLSEPMQPDDVRLLAALRASRWHLHDDQGQCSRDSGRIRPAPASAHLAAAVAELSDRSRRRRRQAVTT